MIELIIRAEIETLLRLEADASPLPWDNSKWYSLAYVKDGTNPSEWWATQDRTKQGECPLCVDHPETFVKTVTRQNHNMHVHAFLLDNEDPRAIYSTVSGEQVVTEGDDSGLSHTDSDFIVSATKLAPALARLVIEQDREIETAKNVLAILSASGYVDQFKKPTVSAEKDARIAELEGVHLVEDLDFPEDEALVEMTDGRESFFGYYDNTDEKWVDEIEKIDKSIIAWRYAESSLLALAQQKRDRRAAEAAAGKGEQE